MYWDASGFYAQVIGWLIIVLIMVQARSMVLRSYVDSCEETHESPSGRGRMEAMARQEMERFVVFAVVHRQLRRPNAQSSCPSVRGHKCRGGERRRSVVSAVGCT